MSKLSELKASPDVGLAEYPADVCVSAKLAAELETADKALFEAEETVAALQQTLEEAQSASGDPDAPKKPRRTGESDPTTADLRKRLTAAQDAAAEAAATCDAVRERMLHHTVRLTLRGKPNGDWRRWVTAHPARDKDDDPTGWDRDKRYAGGGVCNIDDLIESLGGYKLGEDEYDGFVATCQVLGDDSAPEPATDEWWAFVAANGVPGALRDAASQVVRMHEQVVDAGKSRTDWLANRRSVTS